VQLLYHPDVDPLGLVRRRFDKKLTACQQSGDIILMYLLPSADFWSYEN
jgi:hypothetical protein